MMHGKALLFKDDEVAKQILKANQPKKMKELGRKVKGFDAQVWAAHRETIVRRNSVAKFTQNPTLREALLAAGKREAGSVLMVEASPRDRIWGIGMNEKTARVTPREQWRGLNLLGLILTEVRDDILDGKLEVSETPKDDKQCKDK